MDVFNLFNHPQVWGINTGFSGHNPGSGISNSSRGTFGTISSYRDPRILQFGFFVMLLVLFLFPHMTDHEHALLSIIAEHLVALGGKKSGLRGSLTELARLFLCD